jgi:hypothetical protein
MAILTSAQAKILGAQIPPPPYNLPLPKPLAPNIPIVNGDGTPTREFHLYLTQLDDWLRRLQRVLTT